MIKLPKIIIIISQDLKRHGARAILVGGAVRDYYLNLPIKDYDIEVYGLHSMQELIDILSSYGSVNLVGKSFGVLKFRYDGNEYDFSFPRRESKTAKGHRGFDIEVDGFMSFKEASLRRDFTVNALGYDIEDDKFLDSFGGLGDLKDKKLRHINKKTFTEDSLRVYRAVQFCARFDFHLADETFLLCKKMVDNGDLKDLAKERVFEEFKKLLLKSKKPSIGFELMRKLGILRYYPELEMIIGIKQEYKYHPEGDVWIHTMMSLDAMSKMLGSDEKENLVLMFAVLCHDFGKATTTVVDENGRIRSIGHEKAGLEPTEKFIYRLSDERKLIDRVLPLVEHHLKPSQFYSAKSKDKAIRRLSTKVNISELIKVAKADFLGRDTKEAKSGIYEAGEWLKSKAKNLKVDKKPLENLLRGRDLIKLGLKPSPSFKKILDEVYHLQLNGEILSHNEALKYVNNHFL